MNAMILHDADPELDLVLERTTDVPPELVWQAWTRPEHLEKWFVPRPWEIVACEVDLRPGGLFRTVMRSPEGQEFPNAGCYLEIVENRKLVWTDALGPGFRPTNPTEHESCGLGSFMTAVISLEPHEGGTKYTAIALHSTPEGRKKHADMGFADGWGTCFEQMVEHVKTWK